MTDLLLALLLTKGDHRKPGEKSFSAMAAEKDMIKAMLLTFVISALSTALLYLPIHFTENLIILNLLLYIPFGLSFITCLGSFLMFLYGLLLSPFY